MFDFIREQRKSFCTNDIIEKIEKKYSIKFPKEFIDFHIKHDNDLFRSFCFNINNQQFEIRKFYPLSTKEGLTFETANDDIREEKILPLEFFSFARDSGGNDYFWNCLNNKIYFISWDDVYSPQIVCDSMSEFFELLQNFN